MELKLVTDSAFRAYGRIIAELDFSELTRELKKTPRPEDAVTYVASEPELEKLKICAELRERIFGEMPIQLGYCNGCNYLLNALEYHHSSEVNVAATDAILMVGRVQDITPEHTYDTSKVELFRLPKGAAVELYATTLHYAPCNADSEGFRVAVVLPRGTNTELEAEHPLKSEDRLITAKNKWLIGHPDAGLPKGNCLGLVGENLSVKALM
ncbi:MAG: DUF4867 family protein [Oscillospiraceae bacterium]